MTSIKFGRRRSGREGPASTPQFDEHAWCLRSDRVSLWPASQKLACCLCARKCSLFDQKGSDIDTVAGRGDEDETRRDRLPIRELLTVIGHVAIAPSAQSGKMTVPDRQIKPTWLFDDGCKCWIVCFTCRRPGRSLWLSRGSKMRWRRMSRSGAAEPHRALAFRVEAAGRKPRDSRNNSRSVAHSMY